MIASERLLLSRLTNWNKLVGKNILISCLLLVLRRMGLVQ